MSAPLIVFVAAAVVIRLASLAVSVRHERALRRNGAVEFGAANSAVLALAHVAFYVAATVEGAVRAPPFDAVSLVGLAIYAFGILALVAVVGLLGRLWTVKLLIAADHALVVHPFFRLFRHPNYFLNILPELLGFGLVLHAYATTAVGLLVYLVPLSIRIRQEEAVMKARFRAY